MLLIQGAPTLYRDHSLRGTWKGHREAHIEPDWLLIYRIEGDELQPAADYSGSNSAWSVVIGHLAHPHNPPPRNPRVRLLGIGHSSCRLTISIAVLLLPDHSIPKKLRDVRSLTNSLERAASSISQM